jgi:hypothetical protein
MEEYEIKNYDKYLTRMKRSIDDKIFFTEYLDDLDTLVDFGCANGELLSRVHELAPHLKLVGVDKNPVIVSKDKKPCYTQIISDLPEYTPEKGERTALVLSSVLHEVYHYNKKDNPQYLINFIKCLNESKYDYIFIRDMFYKERKYWINRYCDEVRVMRKAISEYGDKKQIEDYKKIYGDVWEKKDLTHFLLKYTYKENWDREVRENYFSVDFDEFIESLDHNFKCIYYEHFLNRFIAKRIKKDFKLDFYQPTHIKVVLKRYSY